MLWAVHVTYMVRRELYTFAEKSEGKRSLDQIMHIWQDIIEMNVKEIGSEKSDCSFSEKVMNIFLAAQQLLASQGRCSVESLVE
jgi:hypothetical protein